MISRNTIASLLLIFALIFFAYQSTLATAENAATENTDLQTSAQTGQQATTQIQLTREAGLIAQPHIAKRLDGGGNAPPRRGQFRQTRLMVEKSAFKPESNGVAHGGIVLGASGC